MRKPDGGLGFERLVTKARRSVLKRCVTGQRVEHDHVTLGYEEAMAVCLLLAEAADASVASEALRDT